MVDVLKTITFCSILCRQNVKFRPFSKLCGQHSDFRTRAAGNRFSWVAEPVPTNLTIPSDKSVKSFMGKNMSLFFLNIFHRVKSRTNREPVQDPLFRGSGNGIVRNQLSLLGSRISELHCKEMVPAIGF